MYPLLTSRLTSSRATRAAGACSRRWRPKMNRSARAGGSPAYHRTRASARTLCRMFSTTRSGQLIPRCGCASPTLPRTPRPRARRPSTSRSSPLLLDAAPTVAARRRRSRSRRGSWRSRTLCDRRRTRRRRPRPCGARLCYETRSATCLCCGTRTRTASSRGSCASSATL